VDFSVEKEYNEENVQNGVLKLKRAILSDRAYMALKERILEMNSGDFLSIRQSAADMGMSYTPVREAFLRLEEEGALRRISNVGYFVRKPDYLDFLQIYQVRRCIEPYTLAQVFHCLTEEDLTLLEQLNAKSEIAYRNGDWAAAVELDIQTHGLFVDKYENKYLSDLYYSVRDRYKKIMIANMESLEESSDIQDDWRTEHRELLQLIRGGDAEKTVEFVERHIEAAEQRMLRSCKRRTEELRK